jgi:hypothetical protein
MLTTIHPRLAASAMAFSAIALNGCSFASSGFASIISRIRLRKKSACT